MKRRGMWQLVKDVRRVEDYKTATILAQMPEADNKVSANVGELMAVALAAVGALPAYIGGSTPCETDYLAASGAVFPTITMEQAEAFNRATMRDEMDEAAESRRYRMIAEFFHGRAAV